MNPHKRARTGKHGKHAEKAAGVGDNPETGSSDHNVWVVSSEEHAAGDRKTVKAMRQHSTASDPFPVGKKRSALSDELVRVMSLAEKTFADHKPLLELSLTFKEQSVAFWRNEWNLELLRECREIKAVPGASGAPLRDQLENPANIQYKNVPGSWLPNFKSFAIKSWLLSATARTELKGKEDAINTEMTKKLMEARLAAMDIEKKELSNMLQQTMAKAGEYDVKQMTSAPAGAPKVDFSVLFKDQKEEDANDDPTVAAHKQLKTLRLAFKGTCESVTRITAEWHTQRKADRADYLAKKKTAEENAKNALPAAAAPALQVNHPNGDLFISGDHALFRNYSGANFSVDEVLLLSSGLAWIATQRRTLTEIYVSFKKQLDDMFFSVRAQYAHLFNRPSHEDLEFLDEKDVYNPILCPKREGDRKLAPANQRRSEDCNDYFEQTLATAQTHAAFQEEFPLPAEAIIRNVPKHFQRVLNSLKFRLAENQFDLVESDKLGGLCAVPASWSINQLRLHVGEAKYYTLQRNAHLPGERRSYSKL